MSVLEGKADFPVARPDFSVWPVADLRDERADVRFVGWSGPAPDGLARSPVDPNETSASCTILPMRIIFTV
jgi:hypothetical protein